MQDWTDFLPSNGSNVVPSSLPKSSLELDSLIGTNGLSTDSLFSPFSTVGNNVKSLGSFSIASVINGEYSITQEDITNTMGFDYKLYHFLGYKPIIHLFFEDYAGRWKPIPHLDAGNQMSTTEDPYARVNMTAQIREISDDYILIAVRMHNLVGFSIVAYYTPMRFRAYCMKEVIPIQ